MKFVALGFLLKLIEMIVAVLCLIAKKLTDYEAQRLYTRNQKFLTEWNLLNNLTWSQEGYDFSILTFGGYTFITTLFLIAWITDSNSKRKWIEALLLTFGMVFFIIEGFLISASIDYIPIEIKVNAYILIGLCFLEALLFLIDLCCNLYSSGRIDKACQTTAQTAGGVEFLNEQWTISKTEDMIAHLKCQGIHKRDERVRMSQGKIDKGKDGQFEANQLMENKRADPSAQWSRSRRSSENHSLKKKRYEMTEV